MPEASSPVDQDATWPPAGCPRLAWPTLADDTQREQWYRAVISAYAVLWEGHPSAPVIAPVPASALDSLEHRLGHTLPASLRWYHAAFGALSLGEALCSVELSGDAPIQPLSEAWPSLEELGLTSDVLQLASQMVVFGDYLGNGNHFCYDRRDGAVWYFDHDGPQPLTRFFDDPINYLDALMLLMLAEVHEDDDTGETLLRQRHGNGCVDIWRY